MYLYVGNSAININQIDYIDTKIQKVHPTIFSYLTVTMHVGNKDFILCDMSIHNIVHMFDLDFKEKEDNYLIAFLYVVSAILQKTIVNIIMDNPKPCIFGGNCKEIISKDFIMNCIHILENNKAIRGLFGENT